MNHHEGYERMVAEPSPSAVRWWFVDTSEDFTFARGGLCRTTRIARAHMRSAREQLPIERDARTRALVPRYKLDQGGDLVQLAPLARCGY